MPRPNPLRSIASEKSLRMRIAYEREARGMSYEGLASRMTQVGCAINTSAIHKIEKADPPRRITVDELVALSRVFKIGIEDLVQPPEEVVSRELKTCLGDLQAALVMREEADQAFAGAMEQVLAFVAAHPGTEDLLIREYGFSLDDLDDLLPGGDVDRGAGVADRLEALRDG